MYPYKDFVVKYTHPVESWEMLWKKSSLKSACVEGLRKHRGTVSLYLCYLIRTAKLEKKEQEKQQQENKKQTHKQNICSCSDHPYRYSFEFAQPLLSIFNF